MTETAKGRTYADICARAREKGDGVCQNVNIAAQRRLQEVFVVEVRRAVMLFTSLTNASIVVQPQVLGVVVTRVLPKGTLFTLVPRNASIAV
jgi:hypothetical protein